MPLLAPTLFRSLLGRSISLAVLVFGLGARLAAQVDTLANTTYTGVTFTNDISIPNSVVPVFTGNTTFLGTNATWGSSSGLYWRQVGTLDNKVLTFGPNAYLYVNQTGNSLTLGPGTSATGDISIYSDGSAGTSIINQGTLNHTGSSGQIYAPTFTNSGTINATAGTLYLNYPSAGYNATNTGSVTSSGSGTTVYIRGNFDNNGTLTAQNSGVLRFDGTNTTANLGSITLASGGHAYLNGTLVNTGDTLN
ncbi:MAG: hypothetical protein JNG83_06425, partial [Opitutaceae bacterium]|nr:hypothetical protein [Opitutaceae bacterium]